MQQSVTPPLDGCMMHMTSVGGGSLTIYLSTIVQYNLIQTQLIQHQVQSTALLKASKILVLLY